MRIQCPSCAATYEVPDTLLDRPRTVRCARCSEDWLAVEVAEPEVAAEPEALVAAEPEAPVPEPVEPVAATPPAEPETEPEPAPLSAIERLALPGPRIRRHDRMLTTAWAASFAALAAMGVAGYTQRDMLMRQWPASMRVYGALGVVPLATPTMGGTPAR